MSFQRVLVLGGTGFVGASVCERLVRHACESDEGASPATSGFRFVVPTRRASKGRGIQSLPNVEVVETDIHDDASLLRLVGSSQAVINLVAQLHGSDEAFERAHVRLPQRLAAACVQAGVARVVHVSALGVDQPTSRYLKSKAAGEAALIEQRGLDASIVRPSVIFGARDKLTKLFVQLQRLAPVVPLACASARFQPVWVEDVAEAVVRLLHASVSPVAPHASAAAASAATVAPRHRIIECAGPDVMTLADLVRLSGRVAGVQRPIVPLPHAIAYLQAMLFELLPGEPLISRDNIASARAPNVATGEHAGLASLGIAAAAMPSVLTTYLSAQQGTARLEAWRASARRN